MERGIKKVSMCFAAVVVVVFVAAAVVVVLDIRVPLCGSLKDRGLGRPHSAWGHSEARAHPRMAAVKDTTSNSKPVDDRDRRIS